jgi:hypothetical protein
MSASDAAPLPRLGEVFFDVRGSSRSMRLSWYADTGVAVFSIWQGGMCTGTFRLPIDDLPRMVEILRRGPRGAGQPPREVRGVRGVVPQPVPDQADRRDEFGHPPAASYLDAEFTGPRDAGYDRDRFVPPYVREPDGEFVNDIETTAAGPRPRSRHAAYPADFGADRSDTQDYPEAQWTTASYSAQYSAEQYPAEQYPSGQYPSGQYPAEQQPAGRYPAGQYPAPQYREGQYREGQYPAGQYPAGQHDGYEPAPAGQNLDETRDYQGPRVR